MRQRRRWTAEEDKRLTWEWGTCDLAVLANRLDRSPRAVRQRATRLGLGKMDRGTTTLAELARETGYDEGRILTAARRVGTRLRRVHRCLRADVAKGPKYRHYAIEEDQVLLILEELAQHPDGGSLYRYRTGEWGDRDGGGLIDTRPTCCEDCGTSASPHYARGLCHTCYERWRVGRTGPRRCRRGDWSRRDPACCVDCGTTQRLHRAKGRCDRCYQRLWRVSGGRRRGGVVGGEFADPATGTRRAEEDLGGLAGSERGSEHAEERVVGAEAAQQAATCRAAGHGDPSF